MFPTVDDPSVAGAMVSSSSSDANAYGNGDSDDLDFPVDPNLVFSSPPAAPAGGERRPLFQRLWTDEDEIDILRAFAEFTAQRGTSFASHQYDSTPFYDEALSAAAAVPDSGTTENPILAALFKEMVRAVLSIGVSVSTSSLGLLPGIVGLAMQGEKCRQQRIRELELYLRRDEARAALDGLGYNHFSKAAAVRTLTGLSWSDLPIDILLTILQYLEVPQRVSFASVCSTWRSASAASGVPSSSMPWFMSWTDLTEERKKMHGHALTCSFYHLLDVDKPYAVSFPRCFVACCGASHGWLIMVNELSNLVLYNPFTMATIDLPPVTDFSCVEAVYGDSGALEHYIFVKERVHEKNYLGTWFYQKAVLSCSPSKTGDYVVMIIHRDSDWLSFVKAGQSKWQVASTLPEGRDRYADCVYHYGSFYSITLHGMVEKWYLDEPNGPTRKVVVASGHLGCTLSRHLVSTSWGDLLRVRAVFALECPDGVRFQIGRVDSDGCKKVTYADLMGHTMLLGLNHSSCLPTRSIPGLLPRRIYFSSPWMANTFEWLRKIPRGWGGVRTYDLKTKRFDRVFPLCDRKEWINPREVWITPNL